MEENTFYIHTKIDNRDVKRGTDELKKHVHDLAKNTGEIGATAQREVNKAVKEFDKATESVNRQKAKVEKLKKAYEELNESRVKTDEFKAEEKQLADVEKRLNKIVEAKERYLATGGKKNSATYKRYLYNEANLTAERDALKSEMQYDINKGNAFMKPENLAEAKANLETESRKLSEMEKDLGEQAKKVEQTIVDKTPKAVDRIKESTKKVADEMGKTAKHTGLTTKLALLLGVGVRLVFALLRKVRTYMVDGVNNLVQVDKELNGVLSTSKSLGTQLKNSFATALAPAIKAVMPYVNDILNGLIDCTNSVAQFFAVLRGDTTYQKAIKVNEDYAKSVKKASGALASFDKLNVIGGNGNAVASQMFEEVEVQTELNEKTLEWKDTLNEIKAIWDKIFGKTDVKKDLTDNFTIDTDKIFGEFSTTGAKNLASKVSDAITGLIDTTKVILSGFDANEFGTKMGAFLGNIKWGEVIISLGELVVEVGKVIWDFTTGFLDGIADAISEKIDESDLSPFWKSALKGAYVIREAGGVTSSEALKSAAWGVGGLDNIAGSKIRNGALGLSDIGSGVSVPTQAKDNILNGFLFGAGGINLDKLFNKEQNINLKIDLDGREVYQDMVRINNEENSRTGGSLVFN